MSAIKKMNMELENILGREPTIHEQIDILILSAIKERALEYQLAYQANPDDELKEQYQRAIKSMQEIQDRNPKIFGGIDSDGGGDV
jgi:Cft2 family RNA processing exonuclease